MGETKKQQGRQDMQHGHQDQQLKKGQNSKDPQNKHAQDNPQNQDVNDTKQGQQRQGIGTPHNKEEKQTTW